MDTIGFLNEFKLVKSLSRVGGREWCESSGLASFIVQSCLGRNHRQMGKCGSKQRIGRENITAPLS